MSRKTTWRVLAIMYLVVFGSSALDELRDDGLTWIFWANMVAALFNSTFFWAMSNNEDQNR